MSPHIHMRTLDRPMPEATTLRAVQPCAGRLGVAALSPEGERAALRLYGTDLQLCPELITGVAARQEAR